MKLFSTRIHGVLDYLTAGMLLALPAILRPSPGVARLLNGSAIGTLVYSLLTKYELGVVGVLPMSAHLALDGMSGALFCAAPLLFRKENPRNVALLVALGLFELTAALTTETEPSRAPATATFTAGPG